MPSRQGIIVKAMENKHLIEVACEDLGEYNDFNCDWVCKFRKEFTKELNKKSKTKQQWKKN